MNPFENYFDRRTLKRLTWADSPLRTLALRIVEQARRAHEQKIWPDEILMTVAESKIAPPAWRVLSAIRILTQTREYRRSESDGRRSSLIFQYKIYDPCRADAFLFLNRETKSSPRNPASTTCDDNAQAEFFETPNLYPK